MSNRRAFRSKMLLSVQAAVALSLPVISAQAQTWLNPVSGNWSVPTNWFGGVAPVSANTTSLTFGGTGYTATNNIGSFSLNSIISNVTGPTTLDGSTLSFGGTAPAITQNGAGAIQISNAVELAANTIVGGAGAGTVTLAGPLSSNPAAVGNTGNGLTLNNPNGRLVWSGGGTIKNLIANQGTIFYTGGVGTLTSQTFNAAEAAPPLDMALLAANTSGQNATINITGGTLTTGNIYAGNAAGSNGTINFSGGANVSTDTSGFNFGRLGSNAGNGTINITNATVRSVAYEGSRNSGASSRLTVDAGTFTTEQLLVGRANGTTNTLTAKNGGRVDVIINQGGGGMTVGSGSNTISVVDVLSAAKVNVASNFFTVANPGGVATLTINGAGSELNSAAAIITAGGGAAGAGTSIINVANGGRLSSGTFSTLVQNANGKSTINVTDPNSIFTLAEFANLQMSIDPGAQSTLSISNGGKVRAGNSINVSTDTGSSSSIIVDGPNSMLEALGGMGLITGGVAGDTKMTFSNGGVGTFGTTVNLSNYVGSTASLSISGSNSKVETAAAANLQIALDQNAVGTINVSAGGALVIGGNLFSSTDPGSISSLAYNASTGTFIGAAILSGGGGVPAGSTTFSVTSGAVVSIGDMAIARDTSGTSLLTVDAGTLDLTTTNGGGGGLSIAGLGTNTLSATGAAGTLNVTNGGVVLAPGGIDLAGGSSGASGTINITGNGVVDAPEQMLAATGTATFATINVGGASAEFGVANAFLAGGRPAGTAAGSANLNVTSGGFFVADNVIAATNVGTAAITVDGTDSALLLQTADDTSDLVVSGDVGSVGTLNVSNGGAAFILDSTGSFLSGAIFVATVPGSVGAVNLSGGTTSFIGASQIQIGGSGGTLGGAATYTQTGGVTRAALTHVYGSSTLTLNSGTFAAGNLTVDGRVKVNSGGVTNLEASSLTINSGGLIDLTNNGLIINYPAGSLGTAATVRSNIQSGLSGGTTGIVTSLNPGTGKFGVAYAQVGTGTNELNIATFRGVTVDTSTVVARGTYNGDINIDGAVDSTDFAKFVAANGYGNVSGTAEWVNGDFNYDGKVTTADFNYLAGNFGSAPLASALPGALLGNESVKFAVKPGDVALKGLPALLADGTVAADLMANVDQSGFNQIELNASATVGIDGQGSSLGAVVPEPASLSLLALAGAGLVARRRRM